MAIFRGLNVQKAMNDVDDPKQSLINLGLDKRDLDLISGITDAGVNASDFHTLSGLVVDQKKELYSLGESAETVGRLLNGLSDIRQPLLFNLEINDQVQAAAIKYTYLDFSTNDNKKADISTSRVSSWSTIGSAILYGGEVKVTGNNIQLSSLGTVSAPVTKTFRAEVPTHTVNVNINGSSQSFLAMKGIPLQWQAFFRNASLKHAVTSVLDTHPDTQVVNSLVPPTWRITNEDDGRSFNSGDATDANPGSKGAGSITSLVDYSFNDSRDRSRTVEFFYNPAKIDGLSLVGINLSSWTNISLPALKIVDISINDFYELPNFGNLAPALVTINMSANNLSRAVDPTDGSQITANTQLNTLPTTIENLTMNGCFSDSTIIDLTSLTELETLSFTSTYSRNSYRSMQGNGVTPKTIRNHATKGVTTYSVSRQPYTELDNGVCTSPNLTALNISWCNISAKEGSGDITILSNNIASFVSYSNNHNVVNMSNKTILNNYVQAYSSPSSGKSISGKFTGCASLGQLYFYASSAVQGNIQTDFQDLPALRIVDFRWTSISGELRDDSFSGSTSLAHFRVAGSGHTGTDFWGTTDSISNGENGEVFAGCPSLQWIYAYSNNNIQGPLPSFSQNTALSGLYIRNTGTTGTLPNLVGNNSLYYLRLDSNAMTGAIPNWESPSLVYAFLYNNHFSGQVPNIVAPRLYY